VARLRQARLERRTAETDIRLLLRLDGHGRAAVSTGIGFFDHMLEQLARHGGFDLTLRARGDLHVDQHHTVEDVGLVLGLGFDRALGTRRGIFRAGYFLMPMDEALAVAAVDFSGRPCAVCRFRAGAARIGDLETALLPDFFEAFARGARAAVHLRLLEGRSAHHRVEALFKAFARALRFAVARDRRLARMLPSTKELL
jgi:imidazoleglycerol-phosphate dehydratase